MTILSPFCQRCSGPKYLFVSKQFEEYLAELAEFVSHRQGIAVMSGDDGVGKTKLVHTLLERLLPSFQPLIFTKPASEPLAITFLIAQSMGITLMQNNLVNLNLLCEAVQISAQQEKYFFLVLDDAHVLTDRHLEEIYLLSQIEYLGRQLLPIMLVGRKALVQKLDRSDNQHLRKLVHKNINLNGLAPEETIYYIDHHLQQVGSSFAACFADDCSDQLFAQTGGIPRRINQLCDQALNRAWQKNCTQVTRDLLGDEGPVPASGPPMRPLESTLPESQEDQAALEGVPQEKGEKPETASSPPRELLAPSSYGSLGESSGAQTPHGTETREIVKKPTRVNDNLLKSFKFTWRHFLVIGAFVIVLFVSSLLVLKTSSIKQEVKPTSKATIKSLVNQNTPVAPHSPLTQLSALASIPEGMNLLVLLKQVREAQLRKDISLFLDAYSPTFPNLSEKKKEVLRTWKKYNYHNLSFNLENIEQKNANTIIARVIWDITLEDVQSKKRATLVKDYIVHFSKSSEKWRIQSIQEKRPEVVEKTERKAVQQH